MPATLAPNTPAVLDAIVAYLTALTYPDTTSVYKIAQEERIFDVVSQISDGGAVCEVYGGRGSSNRRGYGGRINDPQEWFLLSMCSLETATLAKLIYKVRDALVVPFQTHATLGGGIYNLFQAQIKENSEMFGEAVRNGQSVKMHSITIATIQEWTVVTPPGIIS